MNLAELQDTESIHRNHLHYYILTKKKSEGEIKESIPFTTATQRIKYLGINLLKETKEWYTENYLFFLNFFFYFLNFKIFNSYIRSQT